VNFIYNAAVYDALRTLQGIKVWDVCLANACKKTVLMKYIGKKKKKTGEIADSVEAFIGFLYIKNKRNLGEAIEILTDIIKKNNRFSQKKEKEICTEAFTQLIKHFCEKHNIS